jgi:RHS repeat-associated protein
MKRDRMMKRSSLLTICALTALALCVSVRADKPEKPPVGMGKYVLFLKLPPPVPPNQKPKKITLPDVAKLGGVVLKSNDEYQVIYLPFTALKHLLKDEGVDYVQRLWMGETPQEWSATESFAMPSTGHLTEDSLDQTASWGPKNYAYDGVGNIKQIAELDGNNQVKLVGTSTYSYDAVSRLKQAVVNGTIETYTYDAFGNMTQKQTGNEVMALNIDGSSNRIADRDYDIAGNLMTDKGHSYYYDSMGMLAGMTSANGAKRMFYTAEDERIGFTIGSGGNFSRWTIRDFEGHPLREFRSDAYLSSFQNAEWIWTEDYAYAGGQLVGGETAGPYGLDQGTVQADRRRRHFHLDHLGSVRLITTDTGAIALGVHEYYPFGAEQTPINQEEMNFGGNGVIRPEPLRFTGHQRDFNGSWSLENFDYIDYMHARYYSPQEGRFLSVDPKPGWQAASPQSWNRYSYALNDPLKFIDPDGREITIAVTRRSGNVVDVNVRLTIEIHRENGVLPRASDFKARLQQAANFMGGTFRTSSGNIINVHTTIDAIFTKSGGADKSRHQVELLEGKATPNYYHLSEFGGNESWMNEGRASAKFFAHEFIHWFGLEDPRRSIPGRT